MSATPHHDRLAELEQSNPAMAAVYSTANRAALDYEARRAREAEATAELEAKTNVVAMMARAGGKLAQLAQMRAGGHHLMADMFEANNAHALRVEREALTRESEPPSAA